MTSSARVGRCPPPEPMRSNQLPLSGDSAGCWATHGPATLSFRRQGRASLVVSIVAPRDWRVSRDVSPWLDRQRFQAIAFESVATNEGRVEDTFEVVEWDGADLDSRRGLELAEGLSEILHDLHVLHTPTVRPPALSGVVPK